MVVYAYAAWEALHIEAIAVGNVRTALYRTLAKRDRNVILHAATPRSALEPPLEERLELSSPDIVPLVEHEVFDLVEAQLAKRIDRALDAARRPQRIAVARRGTSRGRAADRVLPPGKTPPWEHRESGVPLLVARDVRICSPGRTLGAWLKSVDRRLSVGSGGRQAGRRNGTAQFVLSLGVRRDVLAAAQYCALALVLVAATLILHVGFAVAGLKTGALGGHEAALAWVTLLPALLAVAACVFALSLTASAPETYLVFLGIPFLTSALPSIISGFPKGFPLWLARGIENLGLLFPDPDQLVLWPHLSFGRSLGGTPLPQWTWPLAQSAAAVAFWIVLGLWRHWRHDFGSRTALK